ncbi:uncharacterized protein MYCGRDRAFT_111491 [Zymoseptoria tritici IPO323]|uniref:Elongation factor methyltransferase 6 n=1 Tax=Zymoseptoria tritici (strain CBS 115943 / IPO323) TaxID=336722 RepID=F9XNT7_ZYMTI|nr:uncharacterized protein MYCGRDRAFT_111491 [Zymoseptoria tritici IPO323]EGP83111.1 hypothetical protein MYCGRDRAFT_111491 [Zymoseptoria tritici IPO323]
MALDEPELDHDGFALAEDLVQSPTHKAASTTTVDFDGLLDPGLLLHEDLAKGNGGQAWPAGVILTKYLLRRKREELRTASILAVAKACSPASPVYITDQGSMLALMQRNIALNDLAKNVKACVYDWGQAQPDDIPQTPPDVVLAADCVYFEPAFPLLQQTLQELLGPSTVCYFCFKRRRRADMHFMKAIKKKFLVEDIIDDPDQPSYSRENIYLSECSSKLVYPALRPVKLPPIVSARVTSSKRIPTTSTYTSTRLGERLNGDECAPSSPKCNNPASQVLGKAVHFDAALGRGDLEA